MTRTIQIVGGTMDGAVYAVEDDAKCLSFYVLESVPKDFYSAADPVVFTETYGPVTEADDALGRWSMLSRIFGEAS